MAFQGLLVTEIFYSLQGETAMSGIPFIFIRLTGCNLRCSYCDSAYAFHGGTRMSFDEVLKAIEAYPVGPVLLTGGEPLIQRNTLDFIDLLTERGYSVSIETHGEVSIEAASARARIVMDLKTPGSLMCRGNFEKNLPFLKHTDEVKFVITSEEDYEWAKKWVLSGRIPTREILFSPALPAQNSPGHFKGIEPRALADKILQDRLKVRFQLQLHKLLWGMETKGV